MAETEWRTWRQAMADALYDEGGFYRTSGTPARHFRTAAHVSPLWARALGELATRIDHDLGEPDDFTVVDVGAGGGELLSQLAAVAPDRWTLIGVDVAPRPAGLPPPIQWADSCPSDIIGVVFAVELLDVVPVDVVELTAAGPRLVTVAVDGSERLGGQPDPADLAWLEAWWSLHEVGDRAEVGLTRDEVWSDLTSRLRAGLAVAIDYEALPERDVAGTLTGYQAGRQIVPMPDGLCDLTAHVRFPSLRQPGDLLLRQRVALQALGIDATRPSYDGSPTAYLDALSAVGEATELLDKSGLGGHCWLLHRVG